MAEYDGRTLRFHQQNHADIDGPFIVESAEYTNDAAGSIILQAEPVGGGTPQVLAILSISAANETASAFIGGAGVQRLSVNKTTMGPNEELIVHVR